MFNIKIHDTDFDDVPQWLKKPFIFNGYRQVDSSRKCYWSIFHFHNETINIWTHLCCIPLFTYFFFENLFHSIQKFEYQIISSFYILSCIFMFFSSTSFHLLSIQNIDSYQKYLQLDMIGVFFVCIFSYINTIYILFSSYENVYRFYIIIMIILLYLLRNDTRINYNIQHVSYFIYFLIISFIIPLCHWFFLLDEYNYEKSIIQLYNIMFVILVYLIGFLCFHFHFPECILSGKFNYLGNGHQIWHICICISTIYTYYTIRRIEKN